jgi:hypothetical protein
LPDRTFYVAAQDPTVKDHTQINGYVPSKFLTRNGTYVMDPVPGASQKAYLYSDGTGSNKTEGKIANPNNYLIVPENYSEQDAREFAAKLANTMQQKGTVATLQQMVSAFWPGGSQELQRNSQWGIPPNSFVPSYTSAASDHFGYITAAAGLPREWAENGGGLHNLYSWMGAPMSIDVSGKRGLSKINEANIAQGYVAGLAAGQPPTPYNDYGYITQPQAAGGRSQIGDGRGITPFSSELAGIDADEPPPPDWPPQQNSQVRYLGSRVRY